MLKEGDLLAGRYTLEAQLGSFGFYITTWRARDARGGVVVLKHVGLITSDDDPFAGPPHLLREPLKLLMDDLRRLVERRPACGLAPWLDLHVDAQDWLLLARPHYEQTLAERHPPSVAGAAPPSAELLESLGQLGCGLEELAHYDGLRANMPMLSPSNLFWDGGGAVVVDYGLSALVTLVEQSYSGPRLFFTPQISQYSHVKSCYGPYVFYRHPALLRLDVQVVLAALYYWLRSGLGVFTDQDSASLGIYDTASAQFFVGDYLEGQPLPLAGLADPEERTVLRRALDLDPARRYPSWRELVAALRALL